MDLRRPAVASAAWLRAHGAALALIAAVAFAPFALAAFTGRTPFFLDLEDHWFPFRLHAWRARQDGEIAHWCRHAFCGFPFLAQLEAALSYPPHWVLDLFHPAKTLLAQIVGHRFVLGALFYAYLTARGTARLPAALGASLVVASGITMSCFSQPAVLRTIAWIPLVFLGAWRISQGRRLAGLLWTALGTGLVVVAGYPPFFQRAALLLPFLILADPALPRTACDWRERAVRAAWLAGGAALGVALSASQWMPAMELTRISQRQLGLDPALLDGLRAEPIELVMLLVPRLDRDGGVVKQGFAYLGTLAVALAALAVVRRRPGAAALGLGAAAALVASMGRAVPGVGDVLASLPLASSFRNPSQYLLAWVFAVPALAAMGLQSCTESRPTRREAALAFGPVAALVLIAALVPSPVADAGSRARFALGAAALVAGAGALVAGLRLAPWVAAAACLGDATTFQFNYPSKAGRLRAVDAAMQPSAPFAAVARRHADAGRDGAPRAITSDVVFNWENHGFAAGVDNVRGVISLLPMHALDLNRIVAEGAPFERRPPAEPLYAYGPTRALGSPRVDLLALRYAVGFAAQPGPGWTQAETGIWERDAVPEARLAATVGFGRSESEIVAQLTAPGFDLRSGAAVLLGEGERESDWPAPGADPGTVRITEIRVNSVVMEADAARDAVLLWSETWDSGWTCTDAGDGRELAVSRANHAHMAVRVPAGRRRIVWRYVSPGWERGVTVSLAAAAAFIALAVWAAARRRPG